MKTLVLVTVGLLVASLAFAKERTWTNSQGTSFVGEFLSQNGSEVTIRRTSDQKEFSIPILQLSQEDQNYLKQRSEEGGQGSDPPSCWAGMWQHNKTKFIFKIEKNAVHENHYTLDNQWLDVDGEVHEETISGNYTGKFHHFDCFNVRMNGDRGVVAARFDNSDPIYFSMANLVRLPGDHEPLPGLDLAKYGWKPEIPKFVEQDYRLPLDPNYTGTTEYRRREEKEINVFKNGDFTKRTASWKGDLDVKPDAPGSENLIAEVEVARKYKTFSQIIRNQGGQNIKMNFMYRCSLDYNGGGLEVRCVRDDGSYRFINFVNMKGKWTVASLNFSNLTGSKSLELVVRITPGAQGKIMFDDFSAELVP